MPHWRSLLYLSAWLLFIQYGRTARCAQIQGQPVGVIYNLQGGSWDAFNKYPASATVTVPLNGQLLGNISHLGAKWNRSVYVDRFNAFGVIAFDQYLPPYSPAYNNGDPLNGLNQGNGWNGPYVAHSAAFPSFAWDAMTNYSNGQNLAGLNAGNDNAVSVFWNGAYVARCAGVGPTIQYVGGIVSVFNVVPGFSALWVTFDGTTPALPVLANTDSLDYSLLPPSGTYGYAGPFTVGFNATVTAVGGTTFPTTGCFVTSALAIKSMGENWSNNVVANGGAVPSVQTVTAINVLAGGLNVDGQIVGTPPRVAMMNVIAPDSLIAATTPAIYPVGSQPWANHNFVSGDLTVNGLVGNGVTKYMDTGLIPNAANSPLASTLAGETIYVYDDDGTAGEIEIGVSGSPPSSDFSLYTHFSDGQTYFNDWKFINPGQDYATAASPGAGFYSGQRISATDIKIYFANSGTAFSAIATGTGTPQSGAIFGTFDILFMAGSTVGTPALFTKKRVSFAAVTSGYDSTHTQALYNRVQTFRTAIGGGFR